MVERIHVLSGRLKIGSVKKQNFNGPEVWEKSRAWLWILRDYRFFEAWLEFSF
jgi:hypothetical protein